MSKEDEMKEQARKMVTPWAVVKLVLVALVWLVILGAPLYPAFGLNLSVRTAQGESPGLEKVPLTFQQVEVAIHNQVAAGQSWFHFRNDFEADVEVTCEFALNPEEIVEGFSYFNGDERIVGEVLEKDAAREVYESLTQIQRDPGILEQVGDRFRFQVYPVQPGENKPVELRHLCPLEMREGVVEYLIPRENLPAEETVFSLLVDITDDLPIRDLETVGFEGVVKKFGPRHMRVVFERESASFTEDLRIRYRVQADDYAMRFVAHRPEGEGGTFMLLVTPKEAVEESDVIGRDIVFVIDISGSMSGQPLEQTKWALTHILGQLNPDDRFDVVAFDDQTRAFFGGLREATEQNCQSAQASVSDLESAGGTNILRAMRRALKLLEPSRSDRPRAIIFLTDGQGSNPASVIISEVRKRDSSVRVYTFGVGNGVNRPFLERLARDNRGIATLVQNAERLEGEMRRLYERISMPLMVDLDIEFEGLNVHSVYPYRLPDLYRDGEVVIMGRYDHPGRGRVEVRGRLKGEEKTLEMDVVLPDREERFAYTEKLWASRRIAHLMDTIRERGDAEELVQEVTRLGIVYNIVTDYTTFLAVPESLKTDEIKELIRQGKRGYDKKLIDSIEGIRLSQAEFPPGDPVLSLNAPADARKVIAYFPFGLIKRLAYDSIRQHWSVRFLVPRDVADGVYEIQVQVVHADGRVEWRTVKYHIDSTAPEFDTDIPVTAAAGELLQVTVDPFEMVETVQAYLPGVDEGRVEFKIDLETGLYRGEIQLPERFPEGPVTVRVIVRDRARNTHVEDFDIWEPDDSDAHEPPGC